MGRQILTHQGSSLFQSFYNFLWNFVINFSLCFLFSYRHFFFFYSPAYKMRHFRASRPFLSVLLPVLPSQLLSFELPHWHLYSVSEPWLHLCFVCGLSLRTENHLNCLVQSWILYHDYIFFLTEHFRFYAVSLIPFFFWHCLLLLYP